MTINEKPLIVQSDKTLLLNVHASDASQCRNELILFSELIKAPEHIHTYQISELSIWNANSLGLTESKIMETIRKWSKFDIPSNLETFISETCSRFGCVILTGNPDDVDKDDSRLEKKLTVRITDPAALAFITNTRTITSLLETTEKSDTFLVSAVNRGALKVAFINAGYPVDDRVPLKTGKPLDIELKIKLRNYQEDAVSTVLGDLGPGTGYGTVVMPCGSGKTIVGMGIMSRLKTSTLILCPNIIACRQWIKELSEKTTLSADNIGEYSGEKKEIKDVTVCTYQVLTHRTSKDDGEFYSHMNLIMSRNFGLVIYDEVHVLPAPVFKISAELQSIFHIGLTATLVREDNREKDVFSLVGPKKYDIPWMELSRTGFIANAYCIEIKIPLPTDLSIRYATSDKRNKYKIASTNPGKTEIIEDILSKHKGESILIIGQYLEQLKDVQKKFGFPLITGTTPNSVREDLYEKFRKSQEKILIVSKVANYAVDLPDASVAIQISGSFGSRQEEAQRLGRLLRPKNCPAFFYSVITGYSVEEDFSSNRQKFLLEQGYAYQIREM